MSRLMQAFTSRYTQALTFIKETKGPFKDNPEGMEKMVKAIEETGMVPEEIEGDLHQLKVTTLGGGRLGIYFPQAFVDELGLRGGEEIDLIGKLAVDGHEAIYSAFIGFGDRIACRRCNEPIDRREGSVVDGVSLIARDENGDIDDATQLCYECFGRAAAEDPELVANVAGDMQNRGML